MAEDDGLDAPADTMRERVGANRLQMWVLVDGHRWAVTAVVVAATFVLLLAFEVLGPSDLGKLTATDAVGSTFTSIIIAVVTSVTLVLTVAQLVLSQEMAPLGDKTDELDDELEFRNTVEDERDAGVSPAEPAGFLGFLVDSACERAERLRAAAAHSGGPTAVVEYAEAVAEHGESVRTDLEGAEFGTFDVLLPVLNFNYAWKMHAARKLRTEYADEMDDEVDRRIEDLLDVLRFFAPAREYFKAQYFQWEIVNVARETLYASIPALALSGYMILAFDAGGISGATLGVNDQYLFVSAAYAVAFTPFAVLLAYILRILTLIKRTLTLGPFILREESHGNGP